VEKGSAVGRDSGKFVTFICIGSNYELKQLAGWKNFSQAAEQKQ